MALLFVGFSLLDMLEEFGEQLGFLELGSGFTVLMTKQFNGLVGTSFGDVLLEHDPLGDNHHLEDELNADIRTDVQMFGDVREGIQQEEEVLLA